MPAASRAEKTSQPSNKARTKRVNISTEQRQQMIEEAAYFRAQQRGFSGGDPMDDWLMCEKEVDDLLAKGAH